MSSATATPESNLLEPEKPAVVASGEVGESLEPGTAGDRSNPALTRNGSNRSWAFLLRPRPDSCSL